MRNVILAVSISCLMLSAVCASRAQDETPPSVARLSVIEGGTSLLRGDDRSGWVSAAVNAPLVAGDSVFADPGSRAEIQLDHNNVLRLAERTQVRIANLTQDRIQIEVSLGLVDFVVLRGDGLGEGANPEPNVEIDTPNVAVRPLVPGLYRVQVDSDSQAEITVRKGRAEVFTGEGSITVERDQKIAVQGTDSPEYRLAQAESPDDWDEWNKDRDRAILDAQSWQYANRYYTGAADLDQYGHWVQVPGYNWCWMPLVDVRWVPYLNGRWVWKPFWGWTWVSNEPWGWAPYHYGRWFGYNNQWVWWPGPLVPGYRPVYAPAYVAFLGFGFGARNFIFGPGYGYQQIGWVALGPSDYCYPWWGDQNTYQTSSVTKGAGTIHARRVYDESNTRNRGIVAPLATAQQPVQSNVQSMLSNHWVREAAVAVPTESFAKGGISRRPQPVDLVMLREAQLVSGTLPVVPTRESLRCVDRPVSRAAVPVVVHGGVHFFAKTPPPAGPRPFDESVAAIRQMVQQPHPGAANRTSASPSKAASPATSSQVSGAASSSEARQGTATSSVSSSSTLEKAMAEPGTQHPAMPAGSSKVRHGDTIGESQQATQPPSSPESVSPTAYENESVPAGGSQQSEPLPTTPPGWKPFPATAAGKSSTGHRSGGQPSPGGTSSVKTATPAPEAANEEGSEPQGQAGEEKAPLPRIEPSSPQPAGDGAAPRGEKPGSQGRVDMPSVRGEEAPPPESHRVSQEGSHPQGKTEVARPMESRIESQTSRGPESSSKDTGKDSGSKKN